MEEVEGKLAAMRAMFNVYRVLASQAGHVPVLQWAVGHTDVQRSLSRGMELRRLTFMAGQTGLGGGSRSGCCCSSRSVFYSPAGGHR